MKALEDKIIIEGKVLPGNVLKVGSFLNHQLDVDFIMSMGQEIKRLFSSCDINKIVTIETSGIPIAFAAGVAMHLPVVFAKKNKTSNLNASDVYCEKIFSFTHNTEYNVVISKEFLNPGDKVLIVDDFLAVGNALKGLINLVKSSGAEVVGMAVAIEKGFQHGGDKLRRQGLKVESLAIIDSMDDDGLTFRPQ